MPQPIVPIHQLNNLDSLFNNQPESDNYDHLMGSLSVMQQQLMGGGAPQEKTAARYSDTIVNNLEAIAQEEEDLITVANSLATSGRSSQTYYRVPKNISDAELIGLKTQGFVVGSGRVVAFTDRAKTALRDKWLVAENTLKKNRVKDGFEHPAKTASSDKFTRTSERKRKIIVSE